MNLATQLRVQYDALLKKAGATPKQTRAGRTRAAEKLIAWCAKHEINPSDYMPWYVNWALHSGAPVEMYRLRSNGMVERWRTEISPSVEEQRTFSDRLAKSDPFANLRPITRAQEAMRQRYTMRKTQDLCVIERGLSGGYDARSKYCPTCPQAVHCHTTHNQDHGIDVARYRLQTA